MPEPEPKLRVAICGGGIAGLTTALAFSKFSGEKRDITIDIFEADAELTEIGAGIGMWLRPWKILCELGLAEDLKALLDRPFELNPRAGRAWEMRKADQPEGVSFFEFVIPIGILGFHRTQFLEVLAAHLNTQRVSVHYSKRLVSYTEDRRSSVQLSFADGTTASADVLIGCDGIHSRVRKQMLAEAAEDAENDQTEDGRTRAKNLRNSIEPVWTGMTAYRNIVTQEKLTAKNADHRSLKRPVYYNGKCKIMVTYPISNGKIVNVAAMTFEPEKAGIVYKRPITSTSSVDSEVRKHYAGCEEAVQQILGCCENTTVWVINQLNPLSISTRGNVAVLGDAAHAMAPTMGSGAGQAVEDAYILGALLAHPSTTRATVRTALKIYEAIRLPHANEVLRKSTLSADIGSFMDPRFAPLAEMAPDEIDIGALWELGHTMIDTWRWAWTTSIDGDLAKAFAMLKEQTETAIPAARL